MAAIIIAVLTSLPEIETLTVETVTALKNFISSILGGGAPAAADTATLTAEMKAEDAQALTDMLAAKARRDATP